MSKQMWRWLAAGTFLVMLVFNGLAGSTTLLGGRNTAAVSNAYPTLFTPAGYTFAIWGVIYLLLAGYTLYQLGLFGKITGDKDAVITKITPLYVILSLVNTAWIFAWQYGVMWLSVILIVTMLVLLIKIQEFLRKSTYTPREKLLIRAPFSVYFGWLTVATVANISVWLVSIGWNAFGISRVTWLVLVLLVAASIAIAGMVRNRDWMYGAVFVWAFCGILWERIRMASYTWNEYSPIVTTLLLLIVVLAITVGYSMKETSSVSEQKTFFTRRARK